MILARNVQPGNFYPADTISPSTSTASYSANTLLCLPFSRLLRADAIVAEFTSTGGDRRAALYSAGVDGRSGELIEFVELEPTSGDNIFEFTAPRFEDRPLFLTLHLETSETLRFANASAARGAELCGYSTLNTSNLNNYAIGFEMAINYADGPPLNLRADTVLGISAVPALALRSA